MEKDKEEEIPKLRYVQRLDSIRLDAKDKTYFTNEGYFIDRPILTSCGIFEYINPDGSVRRELRLPEHVFSENSLKTYKGKPIIITHEAGVVNKKNVDKEQIGTILSNGYQDEDNVRAEIIIHDTDAVKECGLRELSLGYNLDLIEKPGVWNGEPYDAIQTNIVINHLALVVNARAGERARLNMDGSDLELKGSKIVSMCGNQINCRSFYSDPVELKKEGGKQLMKNQELHVDGIDMTPEELVEAIKAYKNSKTENVAPSQEVDSGEDVSEEFETPVESAETPDTVPSVSEDENNEKINKLIVAVKELLAALEGKQELNKADEDKVEETKDCQQNNHDDEDHFEDKSQSMNQDSAAVNFQQRLSICRMGDKLHLDGLESKSIIEAKKVIIAKVLPAMRLDGKSNVYVDAAYDIAVSEVQKRKDVSFQKQQMSAVSAKRIDSKDGESMAFSARQRMIEREGGKE